MERMNDIYTPTDRFEELDRINLDAVFKVLGKVEDNLYLDHEMCSVFLARILNDQTANSHPKTVDTITRLLRKAIALSPFNHMTLNLAAQLSGDPLLLERAKKIARFEDAPSLMDMRRVMSSPSALQRRINILEDILTQRPGHIVAASQRLLLDYYQGNEPGPWLSKIVIPPFAQPQWDERLFLHYSELGMAEDALRLWPSLIQSNRTSEVLLNRAAEMFAQTGETLQAIDLYEKSLTQDPAQGPVRYRLSELKGPTLPDMGLLDINNVTICIYSWNKADDLKMTLESLAKTTLGPAKIRILLNGCTDNSEAVTESARSLFPDNDFQTLVLPVNVGAPAARNWLGSLPEVRQSEFVAYLDDDVELPSDWLGHYLTEMQKHPTASVVGSKVIFGSNQRMIQYLYRSFSLAEPGLLKLTDPTSIALTDIGQYDFCRSTDHVMGCCHLLRMAHMPDGPDFDLRYSPSQVDDIAHDIKLRINGGEVRYCGLVKCIHHQNTGGGFMKKLTQPQLGQILGNDTKFYYFFQEHLSRIKEIMK